MNSRMAACIEEISGWIKANRLKLNTDKTQFIWHGNRMQLTKVDNSSIELDESKFQRQLRYVAWVWCWMVS